MPVLRVTAPESHLLRAALGYAGRGWGVLPLHGVAQGQCSCGKKDCGSPGKHPRTLRGLKDATINEDIIESWWDQWPAANVGLATGSRSGLFMLGPDGQ